MDRKELVQEINRLKKEKNAVILAHCYEPSEVDEVADFVGDSLYLSRQAAKTNADIVVFAGVYFMAETAKILSPNKKVLLPNLSAGCAMADMVNLEKIKKFKTENPNIPVVCYVNSTAEVKSQCDICCTSANAVNIVKSLNSDKVLFVPDRNLGGYVQSKLNDVEVICYDGCCPIHDGLTVEDVKKQMQLNPNAKVLVHPECIKEVTDLADYVGSTTGIMNYVKESSDSEFIIVTEIGVVERLERDYKNKKFIHISDKAICKSMKYIDLEAILLALKEEKYEINVSETLIKEALAPIEKMIAIS